MELSVLLAEKLEKAGITVDELKQKQLIQYLVLLEKWNRRYNLTAVRDIETMVSKHIVDSLSVLPWIKGNSLLDVGTGAGLPGIPLAILFPQKQHVLLDSNGKKTRFLLQVKHALALTNVEVQNQRVETYVHKAGFSQIISRAFASLGDMVRLTEHLLATDGELVAMKAVLTADELAEIPARYAPVIETVPGCSDIGTRTLVMIKKRM